MYKAEQILFSLYYLRIVAYVKFWVPDKNI